MGRSQSVLGFRPIAKPKYAEEISGEEHAVFQPWEIMMCVRPSELVDDTYPVYYYIRAGNPEHAGFMAIKQWMEWEKKELGLEFHRFPDVEEAGAGRGLDEKEYMEAWKRAKASGDFKYIGMRENPTLFTFGLRKRGLKEKGPTIVVPSHYKQ